MEVPKIHLSSAETELMQNAEIILTKNRVLQKIKELLEAVQQNQTAFIQEQGLQTTDPFFISPKISKGENYEGLPYIILDYPRMSSGKDLFFIRTMFWWGHYFSSTLHLSGSYKIRFKERIKTSCNLLHEFYITVNPDQWIHHFKEDNYLQIGSFSADEFAQRCDEFDHIKIAAKCSLDRWQEADVELFANWKMLLKLCGLIA